MATLSSSYITLADHAKRLDPDGMVADTAELLEESNEILRDAIFREANGTTSHISTIRTGLPSGTFRVMNQGVSPEKSTTSQIEDSIASLATYNDVDADIATLEDNLDAFLLDEANATIEGLNQTMADTVFYGDTDTNPEKFYGVGPRYDSTSAANGENIIQSSGSGNDCTSIWIGVWHPQTAFMTFPKGSMAGLQVEKKGKVTNYDASNNLYEVYRTYFAWKMGMVIKDWRYWVRIQADTGSLTGDAASGDDLFDQIAQGLELIPNLGKGSAAIYCNRTISSFLRRQRVSAGNVRIGQSEQGGSLVTTIDDIPVRRCDAITNTEAKI